MISLLQSVVDHFVCWVQTGVVDFANFAIVAIAAAARALFLILPVIPPFPTLPGDMSWFYWLVPVSSIVGAVTTGAVLMAAIVLLQIALRWVKAL